MIIAVLTATYKIFIIISVLIIIHELGHFIFAKIFGIETDKIYIYPLGGISKFNMPLNTSPYKEFLILIMGPIFQNIAYFILLTIFNDKNLILQYHIGILTFNLLPIYPLDGGKLLHLIFTKFIPYKFSFKVVIVISYITTIILLISNNQLSINMILTYTFLIYLIRRENLKINFRYNKFLLERYLNNYFFKKEKIISNENNFYRTKKNIIKCNNQLFSEQEYLKKKYNNF